MIQEAALFEEEWENRSQEQRKEFYFELETITVFLKNRITVCIRQSSVGLCLEKTMSFKNIQFAQVGVNIRVYMCVWLYLGCMCEKVQIPNPHFSLAMKTKIKWNKTSQLNSIGCFQFSRLVYSAKEARYLFISCQNHLFILFRIKGRVICNVRIILIESSSSVALLLKNAVTFCKLLKSLKHETYNCKRCVGCMCEKVQIPTHTFLWLCLFAVYANVYKELVLGLKNIHLPSYVSWDP